jgi:hypothetical protein
VEKKEFPIDQYFASIIQDRDFITYTIKQPVIAFAVLSNWLMGNTIYLSKDFTL